MNLPDCCASPPETPAEVRTPTTRRALLIGLAGSALASGLALAAPDLPHPDARDIVLPTDPVMGNLAGDVTLVDFFDLQCPACHAMEPRILRLIAADHGLRSVPVDYPIFGPRSRMGARALLAAQSFGAYSALRERLLERKGRLTEDAIQAAAESLKLDWKKLQALMASPAIEARVDANLARGKALGIKRLPMMFLGTFRIPGELHYADMLDLLRTVRRQQK